ncbi:MAG: glycerophosphodiester phosphodiesterase family protein [Ginsengibacter sp.]
MNSNKLPDFFKIGHRGTRGLMPENTIPAMVKGIEAGANTIEMDVHITKDRQVIVYHDESFNPEYTTMPDGTDISKEQRKQFTFYQMNYSDIKPFIIGKKNYPAFPQQQHFAAYTPLLSELIDSVEAYTSANHLPAVYYLIEIKSNEKTDGFEQPAPEEYMKIVMAVLKPKNLGHRLFLQSFDVRPLQVLHREYPEIKLGFLTGDKKATFDENLNKLGFTPAFYNPAYKLVTPELVRRCHEKNIMIEPWTVETIEEMKSLKAMNVDGIITDYPNLFKDLNN